MSGLIVHGMWLANFGNALIVRSMKSVNPLKGRAEMEGHLAHPFVKFAGWRGIEQGNGNFERLWSRGGDSSNLGSRVESPTESAGPTAVNPDGARARRL